MADDDATHKRVLGFNDAVTDHGIVLGPENIDCCGYQPTSAARSLAARYEKLGRLPAGLFVNGVTALEGALRLTSTLLPRELEAVVVGSFDWDPFASHLPFDVTMVRQNVEVMVAEGFALIDSFRVGHNPVIEVLTHFATTGELDGAQEDWNENAAANGLSTVVP